MTAAKRTYLDYNASAPLRPEARAAMIDALGAAGNPSSVHAEGRRARAIVERARAQVAALVNAKPDEVVFTSGGTEANNLALSASGPAGGRGWPNLYTSSIEHPSVLAGGTFDAQRDDRYIVIPVRSSGVIDLTDFRALLADHYDAVAFDHAFVTSFMLANNETGVIQPVREISDVIADAAEALREQRNVKFRERPECHFFGHSDVIQAAGKLPIDIQALRVDLVSLSAHKLGGPKGVGALVGPSVSWFDDAALLKGGGQERRRRAGTENVAGIAGFGVAAELALRDLADMPRWAELHDRLEREVKRITPDAVVIAQDSPRLPNTSCIALPGRKAETLVIALDLAGVAVSAGSACSSGKVQRSHVLTAMGLGDEIASSAIRVSLGWATTPADIDAFLSAWSSIAVRAPVAKTAPKRETVFQ